LGASEPVPEGEQQVVEAVPKKMTPKRKQLSSKIKKKNEQSKAVEIKNSDFCVLLCAPYVLLLATTVKWPLP
jgi:hypothetical protein